MKLAMSVLVLVGAVEFSGAVPVKLLEDAFDPLAKDMSPEELPLFELVLAVLPEANDILCDAPLLVMTTVLPVREIPAPSRRYTQWFENDSGI